MKAPSPTKLYNVLLCRSKFAKDIIMRNMPYHICAGKRKELYAQGIIKRNVWIIAVEIPKSVLTNK